MREVFPRPRTPKQVAFETGVPHELVKKILRRRGDFFLVVERGWYRAFADAPAMRQIAVPEPMVHNVRIDVPLTRPMSPRGGGAPLSRADEPNTWSSSVWEGRRVNLQLYRAKRKGGIWLMVYLAASDKPLRMPEWEEFLKFVRGVVVAYGGDVDDPRTRIAEIEFNADYPLPKVGLKGIQSQTLAGWRHGMLKVYEKHKLGVLRIEAPLWPVDLTPAEVTRIFGELTRPMPAIETMPTPKPPTNEELV